MNYCLIYYVFSIGSIGEVCHNCMFVRACEKVRAGSINEHITDTKWGGVFFLLKRPFL